MGVDIDTTRGHTVEGKEIWAFTEDKFVNGDGNEVIRHIKEKMSKAFVEDTLNNLISKKQTEIDMNLSKTKKDITKNKKRLDPLVSQRSYISFKKFIVSEEFKKLKAIFDMEHKKINIEDILELGTLRKDFDKFKKKISDPEFKNDFITYQDEENYDKLVKQKSNLDKMVAQVKPWRKQFENIMKEYGKENR